MRREPAFFSVFSSRESYLYPLSLFLLSSLLFFPGLGARDLWAPVEPRYAQIARVMLTKGEWLIPTINGDLYADKPILFFWLVLLGSKLAGSVNEWTVRLPSALPALGLILTTYFLGRDLFSPRIGFLAGAILATSALIFWEGRWAHLDMLFTFLFTLSMYFFARALLKKGKPREFLLAYGFMGLATLTKGLIGVVLPGLTLLAFVVARRTWRDLPEWRLPSGIFVFLIITAPWYAYVTWATNGKWLEEFVLVHHVQNYTSSFGHRQPFWYYFANFPLDFLPWTVFAIPALFSYSSRAKLLTEPIPMLLNLWFLVIFLFFSFADAKRGLYLLPVFPPAALLVACHLDHLMRRSGPPDSLHRWAAYVFFHPLWIGALSLPVLTWYLDQEALWLAFPFALLLAGGGVATVVSVQRENPSWTFLSTVFTLLGAMLYGSLWVLPYIDQYKSPRPFSLQVKKIVPDSETLFIYADTMNDFNYYTERDVIPVLSSPNEVEKIVAQKHRAYLLVRDRDLEKLYIEDRGQILAESRVGGKKWYLAVLAGGKQPTESP